MWGRENIRATKDTESITEALIGTVRVAADAEAARRRARVRNAEATHLNCPMRARCHTEVDCATKGQDAVIVGCGTHGDATGDAAGGLCTSKVWQ